LKRRFEQLAVSMASCGYAYSWVMASRDDGAWVPGNEIGKLEDLPREQGSRIVALARTWQSPAAAGDCRRMRGGGELHHGHDLQEYSRREIHVKKVS
jgi:hypothetical protein